MKILVSLLLLIVCASRVLADGEVMVQAEAQAAAEGPEVAENGPSAAGFVTIDEESRAAIERADKLIGKEEWLAAIEVYQQLLNKPGTGLIESTPNVFATAHSVVEQRVRSLPAHAKSMYLSSYDGTASQLLKRAETVRDEASARELVSRFSCSSSGPAGFKVLGEIKFERGDMAGAAMNWERWFTLVSPDSVPANERRLMCAKMTIATVASGQEIEERVISSFGNGEPISVGGREIRTADELRQFAEQRRPRTVAASAPLKPDFERWSADLPNTYQQNIARYFGRPGMSLYCGFNGGCLDAGVLFLNTPDGPEVRDVRTGEVRWRKAIRNFSAELYNAISPVRFFAGIGVCGTEHKKALVITGGQRFDAYDAETGTPLWSAARSVLKQLQTEESKYIFCSPVVFSGGKVITMVQSMTSVILVAVNANDGSVAWSAPVCNYSVEAGYQYGVTADVVLDGHDVAFCTGRGLIGKCEVETGEVKWLVPYSRSARFATGQFYQPERGMALTRIAKAKRVLVAAPADGRNVICLNSADGRTLWRKPIVNRQPATPVPARGVNVGRGARGGMIVPPMDPTQVQMPALIGIDVESNRVVLTAADEVQCLSADDGKTLWTWPVPDAGDGIAALAGGVAIVPGAQHLYGVDCSNGKLLWVTVSASAGAVVAPGADSIAVVSANSVSMFGNLAQSKSRLDKTPGDARERWIAARITAAEGDLQKSAEMLAGAVELCGNTEAEPKLRDLLADELVDTYKLLYTREWSAGNRVAAFQWMRKAMSVPKVPHQCKIGYLDGAENESPHRMLLASGDRLSGQLLAVAGGMVAFGVKGEQWLIAADAVRHVGLSPQIGREFGAERQVLLKNGDAITYSNITLLNGTASIETVYGKFTAKVDDIAAIKLGGSRAGDVKQETFVSLKNGDTLSGKVVGFDGINLQLQIGGCGQHLIAVDDIYTIANCREMPPPPIEMNQDQ